MFATLFPILLLIFFERIRVHIDLMRERMLSGDFLINKYVQVEDDSLEMNN